MALSYEYDDSDESWPFFLLTVLLVLLISTTLRQLWKLFSSGEVEDINKSELNELCEKYTPKCVKKFRSSHLKKDSLIFNKRSLFIIIGWAAVSVLVKIISKNVALGEGSNSIFDPYELLDVSMMATEREVKSAYRKLSLKFHPDKLAKDLGSVERQKLEEQYVLISKAYKALTDEVTRENFFKYGHPDGPQSVFHGIAIPKVLIEGTASPLVLVGYFILLAVILPFFVARWWSNTQSYTVKGIHSTTASYFVDRIFNNKPSEYVSVNTIISWLSGAREYSLKYPNLTPKDVEGLFHDHLDRVHSGSLETAKLDIISTSTLLLNGLLDISTSVRNTEISIVILETSKCIVQAVRSSPYSQILQLPNVDKELFISCSADKVRTLGKLFIYNEEKIGKLLGINDKSQLQDTLHVASSIPHLRLLDARFKVPGESNVTPSSTPHIVLKVLVRSAKHKFFKADLIPKEMLQDKEDFESMLDPFKYVSSLPIIPKTFAPHYPFTRNGSWCCLVVLQKDSKIVQTPLFITRLSFANLYKDFDKRLVKDVSKEFVPSDWVVGTIKIPLGQPAPQEKGDYHFRVIIKSTEYFGGDLDFCIPMEVREPIEVDEFKQEIYGSTEAGSAAAEGEDDSDDSDLDSDEDQNNDDNAGSDYTDIDTDTEVEEDAACYEKDRGEKLS